METTQHCATTAGTAFVENVTAILEKTATRSIKKKKETHHDQIIQPSTSSDALVAYVIDHNLNHLYIVLSSGGLWRLL